MARQERNSVDYFPFLCKEGKAMFYIENKYNNDGFAVWVKLLRQLAITNYHYLHLDDKAEVMMLSAKCRVSEITLIEIINDLVELGEFDKDLWNSAKVLWSQKFIESISDAYNKRKNNCIDEKSLRVLLQAKGILKPPKGRKKPPKGSLKGDGNTQTKLKNTKEDNNISDSFDEFWNLYQPLRKGSNKKKSESLWSKLDDDEKDKAIEHCVKYLESVEEEKFRKLAETYIRQRHWESEILEPKKKKVQYIEGTNIEKSNLTF